VKNVTVSIPEATYRQARIRAAEQGTSISALVATYLRSLVDDDEFTRLRELQRRTSGGVDSFSARHRLSRDEVHDRAALR
jgi:hypothetical protein